MDALLEQGVGAEFPLVQLLIGLGVLVACCLLPLALFIYAKRKGFELRRPRQPVGARAVGGASARSGMKRTPSMRPQVDPILLQDGKGGQGTEEPFPGEFLPSLGSMDEDTPITPGGALDIAKVVLMPSRLDGVQAAGESAPAASERTMARIRRVKSGTTSVASQPQSEVTPVNGRSATGTELVDMKAFLSSNDLMRFV